MVATIDPTDPALDGPIRLPERQSGSGTSENEIKSMWRQSMLGAADDCRLLAVLPAQGPTFARLRERLKLAEGACRQMCWWRDDTRWLYLAPMLEQTHQMVLEMIRMHAARHLFLKLEHTLRKLIRDADILENAKTGHVGMILPESQKLDRTEGRPMQVLSPNGSSQPHR